MSLAHTLQQRRVSQTSRRLRRSHRSFLARLGRSSLPPAPPTIPDESIRVSRRARLVLAVGVILFLGFYGTWTLLNHAHFATYGFDLGIHDQAARLLSQGRSFSTICWRPYFGDHLYFIMLGVVPLYWLGGGARLLIVLQVLAFGLAAVPAFLLAREKLRSEWVACAVAWAYLLNPYICWMTRDEFHPEAIEVPLVFLSFWLLLRRRWWSFLAVAVVLLLVKEDAALLVFGLGVWVALRYRPLVGMLTAAAAAGWLYLSFWVLLPLLSGTESLATYIAAHGQRIPFGGLGAFCTRSSPGPGRWWRRPSAPAARSTTCRCSVALASCPCSLLPRSPPWCCPCW